MNVESGPGTERIVRLSILAFMFVGMGLWFAYDGWIGYPKANFEEFVQNQIEPEQRDAASKGPVYETVNSENLVRVEEILQKNRDFDDQRKALSDLFDGPPSYETERKTYYFGPSFFLKLDKGPTKFVSPQLNPGNKTEVSIQWQKAFGVIITVIGIGIVAFVIHATRSHAKVTDEGLSVRGQKPIPFDKMTGLRDDHFTKKGWVDIDYQVDGNEQTIRLDEYHYNKEAFGRIVGAICERTGFRDPVQAEKDAKRAAAQASN